MTGKSSTVVSLFPWQTTICGIKPRNYAAYYPVLRYSGQRLLTLAGQTLNLGEPDVSLRSTGKPCPLLCARSSGSRRHASEGRGGFAVPESTRTQCSYRPHRPFASVLRARSRSFRTGIAPAAALRLPRAPQTARPSGGGCAAPGQLAAVEPPGMTPRASHPLPPGTWNHGTRGVQRAHGATQALA